MLFKSLKIEKEEGDRRRRRSLPLPHPVAILMLSRALIEAEKEVVGLTDQMNAQSLSRPARRRVEVRRGLALARARQLRQGFRIYLGFFYRIEFWLHGLHEPDLSTYFYPGREYREDAIRDARMTFVERRNDTDHDLGGNIRCGIFAFEIRRVVPFCLTEKMCCHGQLPHDLLAVAQKVMDLGDISSNIDVWLTDTTLTFPMRRYILPIYQENFNLVLFHPESPFFKRLPKDVVKYIHILIFG